MIINLPLATANQGILGLHLTDKFIYGGGFTAVMPHLEHIGLQGTAIFLLQIILHRRFGITRKEHGELTIVQLHDDACIVKASLILLA